MPRTKKSKPGAQQRRAKGKNNDAEQDPVLEAERSNYVFFWKQHELEVGWASQWWSEQSFTSPDGSTEYKTAEHYMMSEKARLFDDDGTSQKILAATDPKTVKALGREVRSLLYSTYPWALTSSQVANFDEDVWNENRLRIVEDGNELKFRQHGNLRALLLGTSDKTLVEASPLDRIWGIGYGEKKALAHKEKWGLNLLGQALMNVRAKLRAEEPTADTAPATDLAAAAAEVPGLSASGETVE